MHPGLENVIWSEISDDDLTKKIGELQKRVGFAMRTGNHMIIEQLQLLIETYYAEQDNRLLIQMEELRKQADPNYAKQSIDIDWDYNKVEPEEE